MSELDQNDKAFVEQLVASARKLDRPSSGAAARALTKVGVPAAGTAATGVVAKGGKMTIAKWMIALAVTGGGAAAVTHGFTHDQAGAPRSEAISIEALPSHESPTPPLPTTRTAPPRIEHTKEVPPVAAAICNNIGLPEVTPTSCSKVGRGIVRDFVNNCSDEAVELFWVDYDCKEKFYWRIEPGEVYTQHTYDTHPWRVRNATTHRLIKEVRPLSTEDLKLVVTREEMPDSPPIVCSDRMEGEHVDFKVENARASDVEVEWVDQNCHEKPRMTLKPGESRVYHTYANHPFRVRDSATKHLLNEVLPEATQEQRETIP